VIRVLPLLFILLTALAVVIISLYWNDVVRPNQARRRKIQEMLDRQAQEDMQRHRERLERSLDELHEK